MNTKTTSIDFSFLLLSVSVILSSFALLFVSTPLSSIFCTFDHFCILLLFRLFLYISQFLYICRLTAHILTDDDFVFIKQAMLFRALWFACKLLQGQYSLTWFPLWSIGYQLYQFFICNAQEYPCDFSKQICYFISLQSIKVTQIRFVLYCQCFNTLTSCPLGIIIRL